MKKDSLIRLSVLLILLVNQTLLTLGFNPLPFNEEEIYQGVSSLATVIVAVYTWWKNSPITKEAQEAQKVLEKLKYDKPKEVK